jgi:hypothetical protein
MTMAQPARTLSQRIQDTLDKLQNEVDAWVSSADPATGAPYLVPLSFLWDDGNLLISTPLRSTTTRNLQATGMVRLAIGPTRDLVLIDGGLSEVIPLADVSVDAANAYAAKTGWDPRLSHGYVWLRIRPLRVQAWREVNELSGRDLMRDGRWLDG